jgi:hypothetical protein
MRAASVLVGVTSVFVLTPNVSYGQAPEKLEFEVASVRLVDPHSNAPVNGGLAEFNFGPLNEMKDMINAARKAAGINEPRNPNRIMLPSATLAMVLQLAFGTGFHQSVHLQGAPD